MMMATTRTAAIRPSLGYEILFSQTLLYVLAAMKQQGAVELSKAAVPGGVAVFGFFLVLSGGVSVYMFRRMLAAPPIAVLPITGAAACVLSAWFAFLSIMVIATRRKSGVSMGDGGEPLLERRMRAQSNAAEYLPIFLILLAIAEMQGAADNYVLAIISGVFMAGRIMHGALFVSGRTSTTLRTTGMLMTIFPIINMSVVVGFPSLANVLPSLARAAMGAGSAVTGRV